MKNTTKIIKELCEKNDGNYKLRNKLLRLEIISWQKEINEYCDGTNDFDRGIRELETVWTDTLERVVERLENFNIPFEELEKCIFDTEV